MDSYRINQYNISDESTYSNRLIQGGLRYQKFNLSTAGDLQISNIGFIPTVSTTPVTSLPGSFECSDQRLTRIWQTGARTIQLSEIPARSLPDFWEITSEGAFVKNAAPQPYFNDLALSLTEYQLEFWAKPIKGGFGFTLLSDTLGSGIYLFVNAANSSVSAHAGSTEMDSPPLALAELGTFPLNEWYQITALVNMTEISVAIGGKSVLQFSQTSSFAGSFGLGASFGQSTYFQNVSLRTNGKVLYSSTLTTKKCLQDFLLGTNPLPVIVDGSRRDRISYPGMLITEELTISMLHMDTNITGDVYISAGPSFASTGGREFINGAIDLIGSFQLLPGFFASAVKIQQPPRTSIIQANMTGLIGYSFDLVAAMGEYHQMTGDVTFAHKWAPKIMHMLDWADSQTLSNGLFNVSSSILGGDWNYYDPAQTGVVTKFNAIYAYSLQQSLSLLSAGGVDTARYEDRLDALRRAIDEHLWSDSLKAYFISGSLRDALAQDANALAVLANIPRQNHTSTMVMSALSRELFVPAGALAFSNTSVSAGFTQSISPFASSYHLKAAFYANDSQTAKHLLYSMWNSMSDPHNANYTGCFWETLTSDGLPGLGDGTSMCHAWSSGPTAELSRNVLGIQAAAPGFKEWKIMPQTLDLNWAKGKHPTPHGDIQVGWEFDHHGLLTMNVVSPNGTNGRVYLPKPLKKPLSGYKLSAGSAVQEDGSFIVHGGSRFTFHQT